MALRCLLVSLVASLGFELPSGQNVTSWTISGQHWVAARTVDLSALGAEASGWLGLNDPTMPPKTVEVVAAPVPTATVAEEAATPTADLEFDAISGGMAQAMADDLPTALAEPAMVALAPQSEPAPAADLCQPEGDSLALAFPVREAEATAEEGDETVGAPPAPADRLSSAVRLTKDAVQAWALLVQSVGTDATLSR